MQDGECHCSQLDSLSRRIQSFWKESGRNSTLVNIWTSSSQIASATSPRKRLDRVITSKPLFVQIAKKAEESNLGCRKNERCDICTISIFLALSVSPD